MKSTLLILSLIAYKLILSQSAQHVQYGKKLPANKNVCLDINRKSKRLKKPEFIYQYKSVETIKLVNFDDELAFSIDSVMEFIKPLANLKTIIFDHCDLVGLSSSFASFKKLEEIKIINETEIEENVFFPLLKDNTIKSLVIQTKDMEVNTDSISYLTHLSSLMITTSNDFKQKNYSVVAYSKDSLNPLKYTLVYGGEFFKEALKDNNDAIISRMPPVNYSTLNQYKCINQPIPGVNINDTLYSFYSSENISFTYQSGSKIRIDRNAFMSMDGKPYKGHVKLFYREFRTPVEIMLSGIPMTNDVNGETKLFKSGGMYQIQAFDANNNSLQTKSDMSVQINFAMTDTSKSFQFFSLNNDGSWATVTNTIKTIQPTVNRSDGIPESVKSYFDFLRNIPKKAADTTTFNTRFNSNKHIYTYRKDNFKKKKFNGKDTVFVIDDRMLRRKNAKGFFRVKYLKQTQDKEIVFTIVPASKNGYAPNYMSCLFNRTFVYKGDLSKPEFKKEFGRNFLGWDLRPTTLQNSINLDLKGASTHKMLSAQVITLNEDKTYKVHKTGGKILNIRMAHSIKNQARNFDKVKKKKDGSLERKRNSRTDMDNYNTVNYKMENPKMQAYKFSIKKQTKEEQKMGFEKFVTYANSFNSFFDNRQDNGTIGMALLQSGMGFKNIDCYIHSGQMQDILVNYQVKTNDISSNQTTTILYTSINTSMNLYPNNEGFKGYYFKNKPNYIIRFSDDIAESL